MKDKIKTPFQSINPAYRKIPVVKKDVDDFATQLSNFLKAINESESEEYNKNVFIKFLNDSFYNGKNTINTKGRIDLAIYENETPIIVFEFKKPKKNDADMISKDTLNAKAMHQLIKYYFDERSKHSNTNIKHLVASNAYEWFVFDERDFDKVFYCNTKLKKEYETCVRENKNEDYFYKIAKSFLEKEKPEFEFTYFDLREQKDRSKIRALYKLFSPQNLLKQPFANDSNSLNKEFYNELLHIIGLEEEKEGSKKLIRRKPVGKQNDASLLENVIFNIERDKRLRKLQNPSSFGETEEEQYFGVALELCITWIDRVLFLKLLESQLVKYHKGDNSYRFLNIKTIPDFDALKNLFFSVLAKKQDERKGRWKEKFEKVPYLNSSLFEPSSLEDDIAGIEVLDNTLELEIFKSTKLLDGNKPSKGKLNTLEYLFRFLDSYNFASEGTDEEQEDRKALINASVLGLIFEKINGYKDGSFFTPGFITMYMCRETLRRAVVQKFNEKHNWKCEDFGDLKNHLVDKRSKKEVLISNQVIDELKICDPAVGSGHFLVSALNELIAIKSELGILADKNGERLPVTVTVENDELMVMDGENIFEYTTPLSPGISSYPLERAGVRRGEVQRIQETLFHEKEKLIEHCLFGVDINGNSVKICRLRLWIELLKNTYYILPSPDGRRAGDEGELQTLPNIDINIKRGNSLISRFALDADLSTVFRQQKFSYDTYSLAVESYKTAPSKQAKEGLLKLINEIKEQFKTTFYNNDPLVKQLSNLRGQLALMEQDMDLFGKKIRDEEEVETQKKRLKQSIANHEQKIQDIKDNKIYRNAFEWRFEFPEVMDKNGNFVGFDVVIGNPPYGVSVKGDLRNVIVNSFGKVPDFEIYYFFIELSKKILNAKGIQSLIIPNTILFNVYAKDYRLNLLDELGLNEILDCTQFEIFEDATVRNVIIRLFKTKTSNNIGYRPTKNAKTFSDLISTNIVCTNKNILENNNHNWGLVFKLNSSILSLISKIKTNPPLAKYFDVSQGYIPYRKSDLIKIHGISKATSIVENREWHSDKKTNNEYKQEIWGSNLTKYNYTRADSYIWYGKHLAGYVDLKYFNQTRLLIREITSPSIIGCIVSEELVNDPQIISVISKTNALSISLLWAIINSKLATFFHYNSSPKATKGAFPKILVEDIKQFPLPEMPLKQQQPIIALADKILTAKKKDPDADTSALEKEIDELVYELYGLTKEEIDIVEGKKEK